MFDLLSVRAHSVITEVFVSFVLLSRLISLVISISFFLLEQNFKFKQARQPQSEYKRCTREMLGFSFHVFQPLFGHLGGLSFFFFFWLKKGDTPVDMEHQLTDKEYI